MPKRAPARSIYILILLFLINLMNFFDRTIPAVVLEPIRKEFALDDTALGLLGASFTLIYAVAGIPLGYLADRFRRTGILAAGLTVWSLLTAASGLAWSFMSFFWIRLLVGVGEASCAPAANSLIGDLFPSEKRARALGIFMLGLPLGLLLAFSIVGALAQDYGWRVPFYLAAIPGFVVAALIMFAAEPVRGSQETYAIDATTPVDRPMRRILAIPTVWWIIASGATVNFAAYAMSTFLPTMLIRYHGLSIGRAGVIAAIVLGATGLVGLTAGGWLADYLHKKFLRGRLLLASCSMLVATPCSTSDLRSRPVRPMPRRFCYRWAGYSTSATTAEFIPPCRMSSNPGCGPPQWLSTSSFSICSERVSAPLSPARYRICTQGRRWTRLAPAK